MNTNKFIIATCAYENEAYGKVRRDMFENIYFSKPKLAGLQLEYHVVCRIQNLGAGKGEGEEGGAKR